MARPVTLHRNLHRDPHLQAPLPLHQGSDRAKTRFSPFHRKGFVQNEMGSHFKAALEPDRRFHQHDRQSALIDRCCFSRCQHAGSFLRVPAVHDDGFESLASDAPDGIVRGRAVLDGDFQIAEHPSQDAHCLFVRTQ